MSDIRYEQRKRDEKHWNYFLVSIFIFLGVITTLGFYLKGVLGT